VSEVEEERRRRLQAERRLAVLESRFKDFAAVSSDWFFEMGPDYRFTAFHGGHYDEAESPSPIVGLTRWEAAGPACIRENIVAWGRHMADLFSRLPVKQFEYRVTAIPGDEDQWCEISARPRFDENGKFCGYMGAGRNISRQKAQRDALLDAVSIAEEANRAKTEFLSRMSHELRTPLNGVIGFADLLTSGYAGNLTNRQMDYLVLIRKAGFHLLGLIDEILDLSTIEGERMRLDITEFDLTAMARDCVAMTSSLHPAKANNITISLQAPRRRIVVRNDQRRLQQILLNLLSNAIKYNRLNGTVELSVETTTNPEGVRIDVKDTGLGIAPKNLDRIFEPFDRLGAGAGDVDGTGIGLTITKRLIERMGGTIAVHSVQQEGTTFTVTLPRLVTDPDRGQLDA